MSEQCYVQLTVIFKEEDDKRWTALCRELGTAAYGNSLQEAQKYIKESILLHLNSLEDVGERDRFFKENGINIRIAKPKSVRMSVPTDSRTFVHPQFYPCA